MPPNQATLKYVKDSQTTLGCVSSCNGLSFFLQEPSLIRIFLSSKFFSKPNGTKAPSKQSKLSFSSKASTSNGTPSSSSTKENEDDAVDMKDDGLDAEVTPEVKKEAAVDSKDNMKPGKGTLHNFLSGCTLVLIKLST
jgi:DNA ligase-1